MAPELIDKRKFDTFYCNIWSLGVTFYVMANGYFPWIKEKTEEMIRIGQTLKMNDVPNEYQLLIQSMIQVNPRDRCPLDKLMKLALFNFLREVVSSYGEEKRSVNKAVDMPSLHDNDSIVSEKNLFIMMMIVGQKVLGHIIKKFQRIILKLRFK
jgi:serine/threonine protein kinase